MPYDELKTAFELLIEALANVGDGMRQQAADLIVRHQDEHADKCIKAARSIDEASKTVSALQITLLTHLDEAVGGSGTASEVRTEGQSLFMDYNGVKASAIYVDGHLTLLDGSSVKAHDFDSLADVQRERRQRSREDGTLIPTERADLLRVTRKLNFNSPSAAAQFVGGCSLSGNREWHLTDSQESLGEWLRRAKH